jgi:hypothetical protein
MDEKDFEALVDMFATPGWKLFAEGAANLESALTKGAVDGAPQNDQWQFLRGQVYQLRSIIGYERYIREMQKQQEEDAALELFTEDDIDVLPAA